MYVSLNEEVKNILNLLKCTDKSGLMKGGWMDADHMHREMDEMQTPAVLRIP